MVVYKIKCSRYTSCYVGQTVRHLTTRFKEHLKAIAPVKIHVTSCSGSISMEDDVSILALSTSKKQFIILEAFFIDELKPALNTYKDEFK